MYEDSERPRDEAVDAPSGAVDIKVDAPEDDDRRGRDSPVRRSRSRSRSRSPVRRELSARRSPLPVRRPSNAPENPPRSEVLGCFGLSVRTREIDLEDEFSKHGQVVKVVVVYDQRSDRSRGFGFVTMASVEDAQRCVDNISGMDLQGRKIRVDFSVTHKPHQSTPGEYMGIKRREYEDRPGGGRPGGGFGGGYDRYDAGRPRYDDRRSDWGRRDDRGGRDFRDSRDSRDSYRDSRDSRGGDSYRESRDSRDSRGSYGRDGRSDRDDFGRDRDRDSYSRRSRDRSPPPRRSGKWSPSPPPRRRDADSRSPLPAGGSSRGREPLPPRDFDDAPSDAAVPAARW